MGRFVERFALHLSEAGFPRMPARVFVAILVSEDGQRTAAELGEVLRVSPAAVSGAVQYLVQVGLVARDRKPGERRDHYRLYDDTWYEALTRQDSLYTRWEQDLRDGMAAVGPDSAAGARLEETRQFFGFLREEFSRVMDDWRRTRAAGGR
ncbi:MarR family transcriptional regulator [Streptomyces rubellomurinus subsp. indigoferus]|uniref:MarR family transcriptional regulator n=1 Tax=Streptomyces rubellomurinus (strain ATCC 31215) TaxID=359131 RepID=A0A0F2T950_STRR3|nr:MarR family transcriptional regulator [Streptomyces rubellomurinus subsp. indigoferus]KJS58850.1 MarR family transcriptional regulator [Streptomyces rubellomurinus]